MARDQLSAVLILLILSFTSVFGLELVSGGDSEQKTWCVAKPSSDDKTLQTNIDYACSQPNVNCTSIQMKNCACPCSLPNTLINRASVAMNLYYQAYGRNVWNCDFANSGLIVITDPSYEGCTYELKKMD